MGSTEQGGDKAAWIEDFLQNQLPYRFPRIKGFVWFHMAKETDWRIDSSVTSQQAFASGVSSDYYAGNVFGNLEGTTIGALGGLPSFRPTTIPLPTATLIPTTVPTSISTPTPIVKQKTSVVRVKNDTSPKTGMLLTVVGIIGSMGLFFWKRNKLYTALEHMRNKLYSSPQE